ncbi:SH3 domain-containing protein [Campylobacter sp. MG1]|uniref:SH3 domain-containing protein n=1 Tax=Campylobacter sp. MG1 TaxID=2976332 RepID=UPI00226C7EDA|nr:SH3 domain-containing protein [Campylobacter sp. MG1]
MKKILLLIFSIIMFAAPTKELSVMDAQVYTNLTQNDEANFDSNVKEEFNDNIELVIDTKFSKKNVKVNEIFYVDVVINSNYEINFTPEISFNNSVDMQILNKKFDFISEKGVYKTRIYMQANTANAKLSGMSASLFRNTQLVGKSSVLFEPIIIETLPFNKDYSNLVASNLEISALKCTMYDDENTICGMNAKANNTNFNNFLFKNVKSQSITNIGKSYEDATCSIALIFDNHIKNFSFSYYDPLENKFIDNKFEVKLEIDEVSTQTELNPINKEFNFYLQIISLLIAIILLVIVLVFKRFFSLVAVALLLAAFSFLGDTSIKSSTLKDGANIRILPTDNSTIFYKNNGKKEVKILNEQKGFVKIALDENTSGWVKNEDIE